MWLATPTGFYSAVEHRTNRNLVVVRTRVHEDAVKLAQRVFKINATKARNKIISYNQSDYPWRVIVTKGQWASFVAQEAQRIDYGNFKSAVKARQGAKRESVYHRVWSALLGLERLDRVDVDEYPRYTQPPLLDDDAPDMAAIAEWDRLRQWMEDHKGSVSSGKRGSRR